MKKLISALVIVGSLSLPFLAKADVPANTFFFGDGKGYNVDGQQMYYCFADSSCYSVEGVFAFVRQVQSDVADLQTKVSDLQNQVNNLQSPIVAGNSQTMETQPVSNLLPAYTVDELIVKQNFPTQTLGVGCYVNGLTISCYINGPLAPNFSITVDGQPLKPDAKLYFGVGETHNYTITYHEDGRTDTVISKDFVTTDK